MAERLKLRNKERQSHTILFLGSRTGGLFRHPDPELLDKLKVSSPGDISHMTPAERFRVCKRFLDDGFSDVERHSQIRKTLEEQRIGSADLCVAELMKKGFFDVIITTNIGDELRLAFIQSELKKDSNFIILNPISDDTAPIFPRIYSRSSSCFFALIQANGDFSTSKYVISDESDYLEKYPMLQDFIKQTRDWNIMMVGFDYLWDKHIASALFDRSKQETLWYINEEPTEDDTLLLRLRANGAMRFENVEGDYEIFFPNLCWHILRYIPTYQFTLDKLTRIAQELEEMQEMQYTLKERLSNVSEQMNVLLQSQETAQKGIDTITRNVNKLLQRLPPPPLADDTGSSPLADTTSTTPPAPRRKLNKPAKKLEEK